MRFAQRVPVVGRPSRRRLGVSRARRIFPSDSNASDSGSTRYPPQAIGTAAGERNLWIVGGGNVASQFADEGLLDEVLVTVVPVVLGVGKPVFDHRLPGGAMQLMGTRTFESGLVELLYEIRR